MLSRLVGNGLRPKLTLIPNLVSKRWSGHNAMNVEPSNYGWRHFKDMVHLYTLLSFVPIAVVTTIINIRANPEITEIPEGYTPRHWEYYKHPIARWMAKRLYHPIELDYELKMANLQFESEALVIKKIQQKVEATMKFYNDHRSKYFRPFYGEWWRIGRDDSMYGTHLMHGVENIYYDQAYNPNVNSVPTEGYVPEGSD